MNTLLNSAWRSWRAWRNRWRMSGRDGFMGRLQPSPIWSARSGEWERFPPRNPSLERVREGLSHDGLGPRIFQRSARGSKGVLKQIEFLAQDIRHPSLRAKKIDE